MYRWRVRRAHGKQSGYMLLLLMLAVAMLAVTLLGVATNYRQSIRRDREEEMIHRGVQYIRAVRLYCRKNNNSYPPSVDRLLETNNIRYLRKRYKDPMTKDGSWMIAHITDIKLPAANTGLGTSGTPDSAATPGQQASTTGDTKAATDSAGQGNGETITPATGTGNQNANANSGPANTSGGAGEVLGGQAMIGVISKSSQEGIRSFNEKSKYNEWLFVYQPTLESAQPGHIPNGPFNPKANAIGGIAAPGGTSVVPGTGTGTQK